MSTCKNLLPLCGLMLISFFSSNLFAQGPTNCFQVTPNKVADITDSILNNFSSYALIERTDIEQFLDQQLSQYDLNMELHAPIPFITGGLFPNRLLRWEKPKGDTPELYHVSSLDLINSGMPPIYFPPVFQEGIDLDFSSTPYTPLRLVSFYSRIGFRQSILHIIIIIERDASIRCEDDVIGSAESISGNTRLPKRKAETIPFTAFPNPVINQTQIQFSLKEAKELSLNLYNNFTGRMVQVIRPTSYYEKGNHALAINTSEWPAGSYSVVLNDKGQVNSIQLLKINLD